MMFEAALANINSPLFHEKKIRLEKEIMEALSSNVSEIMAVKVNTFHNMSNNVVLNFVVVMNKTNLLPLNETIAILSNAVASGAYQTFTIDKGFNFNITGMYFHHIPFVFLFTSLFLFFLFSTPHPKNLRNRRVHKNIISI